MGWQADHMPSTRQFLTKFKYIAGMLWNKNVKHTTKHKHLNTFKLTQLDVATDSGGFCWDKQMKKESTKTTLKYQLLENNPSYKQIYHEPEQRRSVRDSYAKQQSKMTYTHKRTSLSRQ